MLIKVSNENNLISYDISKKEDILAEDYELLERLSLESNVPFYCKETLSEQNKITLFFFGRKCYKKRFSKFNN